MLPLIALQGAEIKVDSAADSGAGSLRQAVGAANSGDVVLVRTEAPIVLATPITVSSNITIQGETGPLMHTLSGGGTSRILVVPSGYSLTLSGLTVEEGYSAGDGGALVNHGSLSLVNVRLRNNLAGGSGGAIYHDGSSLTADRSCFVDNGAHAGGGLYALGGNLELSSTAFIGNISTEGGGGLAVLDGDLELANGSILANESLTAGGGLYLENSSGRLVNLTVLDNLAPEGPHAWSTGGASLELGNSIIGGDAGYAGIAGSGITSLGSNLSDGDAAGWNMASDLANAGLGLGIFGNYGGLGPVYPLLPGSPAIDAGDDSLVPAGSRDQRGLARFSDGNSDGSGPQVDIGSFEVQLYVVSALQIRGSATGGTDDGGYGNPFDPSDDADSISSADVFAKLTQTGKADIGDGVGANNSAGGGAVSFSEKLLGGRTVLKGSELEIRRNLAIYGPGATEFAIDGDGRSPVFRVSDEAMAYISGVAIENGSATSGGGIVVQSGAQVDLEEVSLSGNQASQDGGGLAVEDGQAYVFRSAMLGNIAGGKGGAVAAMPEATLFVDNSTVALNQAGGLGGAVYGEGTVSIQSSTLVGNTAGMNGPSVYAGPGGEVTYRNSIFSHGGNPGLAAGAGGALLSGGFNISTGPDTALSQASDRGSLDPRLGPLALNGGTTLSYAPAYLSPAINSGDGTDTAELDQPGNERVRGGAIDIGSVEIQNDAPYVVAGSLPSPVFQDCLPGTPVTVPLSFEVVDPDGDAVTVSWSVDGVPLAPDKLAEGTAYPFTVSRSLDFGMGTSTVQIFVSDDYAGTGPYVISITLVADTTAPVVSLVGSETVTLECGDSYTDAGATAIDECDGPVTTFVHDSDLPESGPLGKGSYFITDSAGNDAFAAGTGATRTIVVKDTRPPVVSLNGPASVSLECGSSYLDAGATAMDTCDGEVTPYVVASNLPASGILASGSYFITYSAVDSSNNDAADFPEPGSDDAATDGTVTRTILVSDTIPPMLTLDVPDGAETTEGDSVYRINALTDPGFCSATLSFSASASDGCSGSVDLRFDILPNADLPAGLQDISSPFAFPPGDHVVQCTATDAAGNSSTATFEVSVKDSYLNCIPNVAWPNALPLQLEDLVTEDGTVDKFATVQQFLALTDQARWYRFTVTPGSRVTVVLSDLPANFDLVLYEDIQAQYLSLVQRFNDPETRDTALLQTEFAPESFSRPNFAPESFSPESFSPESFSPESFSPESFSPESFSPESFSPESFSPESFSPESFSPESFSPESFSPESFSRPNWAPESFSPESFSPESFSNAQVASMIGFSAFPGVASEGLAVNTFTRSGEFYVRVRGYNGAYSLDAPFTLTVITEPGICEGLEGADSPDFPAFTNGAVAAGLQSIVVWDSSRTQGTATELAELADKLDDFVARPEVDGVVVDLAGNARIGAVNAQADAKPQCPLAKNLVAGEIKRIIDAWADLNPDLQYVVLLGNDDSIPFFRTQDEAFLANESNYVPPVIDSTHSQSSLRYGQVLTQDPYGADCELDLVTGPFPYPRRAVGRLVETAADIAGLIDNYMATAAGVLPAPTSALSTGYDFLDDAASAVSYEFGQGIGGPTDELISDSSLAPSLCWTASDLSGILLGQRHDLVFLAGHFSTGSTLAADYQTRLTASQVVSSGADFLNTLIFSAGCHSGYNTVDGHAINGITKQPDWAQAFARKGALFIAGTGYQYGDTEFVEYGERLYLEFARQLRSGTGPVSIGEALVMAKRIYLAETPLMRGIHEKSIIQTTLYGLPMFKIDMPGARLPDSSEGTVPSLNPVAATLNPGLSLGLVTSDLSLYPDLREPVSTEESPYPLPLRNIEVEDASSDDAYVLARWFTGRQGFISNPAEPVRPLETYLVGMDNTLLRGVGFRGGEYHDLYDFLPLTGAPTTEIRGVYGNFFSEVWYPVQPWSLNYFGAICGGTDGQTRLNVYPSQYLAYGGGILGGIMRNFDSMDFRLYYSDNAEVYGADTEYPSIPALSGPPTIAKVRSEEGADGDSVLFDITILGNPAAGIQEAWITWTSPTGPGDSGSWQSLDLEQDAVDSTRWKGILPLNGIPSGDLRFMVQAASGTGLVSLSTNYGRYYEVGVDEQSARTPTSISLLNPPAGAAYKDSLPLQAALSVEGQPLAGVRVGFRIGTSRISGFTDANGVASVVMPLVTRPGNHLVQAYYQGDRVNGPSADYRNFVVTKQETFLEFEPVSGEILGSDVIVALSDGNGTPLKERTVFFLVDYGTFQVGNAVITDFSGRADLSEIELPPGDVRITAFFNGTIPIPGGDPVTINDDLYLPSSNFIDVTLANPVPEDDLAFDPQQVDVHYKETGKGRTATEPLYSDASIAGSLAFNVALQPSDLVAPGEYLVDGFLEARLAGQLIASGSVILDTRGDNGNHWTTASQPGNPISYVGIHWKDAPRFDSALTNPAAPRIYSIFIGNSFSELVYVPGPGTYYTVFPQGIVLAVKDGELDLKNSSGLVEGGYDIEEGAVNMVLRYGIKPGMVFRTWEYGKPDDALAHEVVVTEGQNFLREGGRMIIRLEAVDGIPQPTSSASPNRFEFVFRLGTGTGETEVRSSARIGEGLYAVPWSSEDPQHKQYRP